jgi:hypothetical protein
MWFIVEVNVVHSGGQVGLLWRSGGFFAEVRWLICGGQVLQFWRPNGSVLEARLVFNGGQQVYGKGLVFYGGGFISHRFICHPEDCTIRFEPRAVATIELAARQSHHQTSSHPQLEASTKPY